MARPFIGRLALRNYKSVGGCDVSLAPFTALVGPNGAGKSNVLDALRFVSDSLRNSLEYALRERGGFAEVRRRSHGHPRHLSIRLEMKLGRYETADYSFRLGSSKDRAFVVQEEQCSVWGDGKDVRRFHIRNGQLAHASRDLPAAIEPDRLYLGVISGLKAFRPVYDALTRMGFYNLSPAAIRELQSPDPAEVLARDGSNMASVIGRLETGDSVKARIEQYLAAVMPGLHGLGVKQLGPKETVEFRQAVAGAERPWRFLAANMSDGTLRALGILVALFQGSPSLPKPAPLIGIEEPEAALHPAAASVLASAILEAATFTQVLVTSHSPDLLDHKGISSDSILAVVAEEGETLIGPVDNGSRDVLREGLYTPGELLRLQQLHPQRAPERQTDLFEDEGDR